jgi:VCBS repeat protein/tetratricopeptide repeat protein
LKKPLLILGALVFAAFATISILKYRDEERAVAASGPGAAEVERVRNFWAAYNQGNALRAQGEYAQASDAFRKALAINPQHEDSLYYLGTSLNEIGEYGQAAGEFRKIVAANPASGRAWSELGNTLSTQAPGAPEDFSGARSAYEHAAELNREQAGPFLRLGLLDLNRGDREHALENFRLAAGFGSPEGAYLLAYTDFLETHDEEALRPLHKILDAYAKDKKITGRGVFSEGDVLPGPGKALTALDKAALKSILMLNWEARRLGGYPTGVPNEFRVAPRADERASGHILGTSSGIGPGGGRGAWADFDKDGHEGLLVAGLGRTVALYRNNGQSFSDVTSTAGLSGVRDAWDAVWTDYDRDGYPDLYLIRSGYTGKGQNLLYHNNRDGTFADVTGRMGLEGERSTARACFADFSGNGRMDLVEVGAADSRHSSVRFYQNDGKKFVEVTGPAGLESKTTAVDCTVADYDRDGKRDVLILYWKQGAALYHNEGNARFSDATSRAGLNGLRGASYSATFFDYDQDHWPDLLISTQAPVDEVARCLLQPNFRAPHDTPHLFHNLANGQFEDVTRAMGLDRCYGTFQVLAEDLDHDGWPDLVMVNGSLDSERLEPSIVLHNQRGKGFKEWFYLPGSGSPSNLIGAAHVQLNGKCILYLARNPRLPGSVSGSGLLAFTIPAASRANRQAASSESDK